MGSECQRDLGLGGGGVERMEGCSMVLENLMVN